METKTKAIKIIITIVPIFLLVLSSSFWMLSKSKNIYEYSAIGALFEILWLPMILLTLLIPMYSIYQWCKDGWSLKSIFLYLVVLSIINFYSVFFI